MSRLRRRSHRCPAAVLAACLWLGASTLAGSAVLGAEPGPSGAVGPAPDASAQLRLHEVLRAPLWQLATGGLSTADRRQLVAALVTDELAIDPAVAVSIDLDHLLTTSILDALLGAGARVVNSAARTVEAYVATDRLAALAAVDGVRAIRPIRRRSATGSVSPVATLHGSAAWQAAGLTGAGVKVGIIDGGFAGMASLLGSDVPAAVHAHCYTAVGTFTANLADCANGETHGTAVAEAIFDMAPGIDLYLADPISSLDEQKAVRWMTGNGVRIINALFFSGLIFEGPGDGTSPYGDSLYALVDRAVASGALWVNAAGNAGDSGWTGPWTDPDSDGLLDFAPGVHTDSMTLAAGADVTVAIRWADPWGASSNNYDLQLYSGSTLVASSADVQAGAGDPFEVVDYRAPQAGTYGIRIRLVSGAPTSRMQLLVGTNEDVKLTQQVADDTLPTPADSTNPGMIAVGAVKLDQPTVIEPYSSRGPTLDGRIKPDLVAADCAATVTDGPFCGTSEAAPFVTGAAAQVLQAVPTLTPVQLADWLRSHASPLGSPVPNSTFGAGRLDLGPLPFTTATRLAFVVPPTGAVAGSPLTGQPTVSLVDASGLVVGSGPGSAAGVSISLASNPTGATLACPGGLTRNAVAGVASFGGCTIDRPGSGYTIRAESAGLTAAASAPVDILAPGSPLPLDPRGPAGPDHGWGDGLAHRQLQPGTGCGRPGARGRAVRRRPHLDRCRELGDGRLRWAGRRRGANGDDLVPRPLRRWPGAAGRHQLPGPDRGPADDRARRVAAPAAADRPRDDRHLHLDRPARRGGLPARDRELRRLSPGRGRLGPLSPDLGDRRRDGEGPVGLAIQPPRVLVRAFVRPRHAVERTERLERRRAVRRAIEATAHEAPPAPILRPWPTVASPDGCETRSPRPSWRASSSPRSSRSSRSAPSSRPRATRAWAGTGSTSRTCSGAAS